MRILILLAAAIGVRTVMLLIVDPSADGDGRHYIEMAKLGLAALDNTFRPPLFPLFIAPFLSMGGLPLVWAAQSSLTIVTSIFAYRWTGSLLAGALIATSPFLIVHEWTTMAEILAMSLLTIGWLILTRPGAPYAIIAGFLLGLAALTRDTLMLLPLFALPFALLIGRFKDFLFTALAALTLIIPWIVHGSANTESRMGYNLWIGTWEHDGHWYLQGLHKAKYPARAFTGEWPQEELFNNPSDHKFKRAAIDRMVNDPGFVMKNWAARYYRLWQGTRTDQAYLHLERRSAAWIVFKSMAWGLSLITLIAGLLALWWRPLLAIPVLYTALIYIPFHNIETRYSLVVFPLLYVGIGMAVPRWLRALKTKNHTP